MPKIARWMVAVALAAVVSAGGAQTLFAAEGVQVSLPTAVGADSSGNQWMLYHQGYLRQQGNQPVYSQGARLTVNGQQLNVRRQTALRNPETGELTMESAQVGNLQVERRIRAMEGGYVRFIDIIHNATAADVTANVQIQTNINYGLNSSQMIDDPQQKGQAIAWVGQTPINRSVVEVYSGQSAINRPTINPPQGNVITATLAVTVPKNDRIAFVHLHGTADSTEQGHEWVLQLDERVLLNDLPAELRKRVINFRRRGFDAGDYEILREDAFDVVELRSGDQFRGTLHQGAYHVTTFYGQVDLPVERVIGLINIGQVRPRQLVITRDGEVFGGTLDTDTIVLELSTGQQIEVPLGQIARIGYRKKADEPEEWTFDQPLVFMQQGDRVLVQPPDAPIEVVTRYGTLALSPSAIAAITFQSEDHGVHEVLLRDGSRFAGLVTAEAFNMQLAASHQDVRFPAASLLRLQMIPPPDQPSEDAGVFAVANGDLLVGSLAGQLKLTTAFATIEINGREVMRLTKPPEMGSAVQVLMWDNTSVTGQLQQEVLQLDLDSGLRIQVPLSLVQEYNHPLPQPSGAVRQQIQTIVADLDAEDWRQRDRAQAQLISMGVAVVGVLEELRADQSPEAQQRIDQVIQELKAGREGSQSHSAPVPPQNPRIVVEAVAGSI